MAPALSTRPSPRSTCMRHARGDATSSSNTTSITCASGARSSRRRALRPAAREPRGRERLDLLYVGRLTIGEKRCRGVLARWTCPGTKSIDRRSARRAPGWSATSPTCASSACSSAPSFAHRYQQADVLVFPGRTDTFGTRAARGDGVRNTRCAASRCAARWMSSPTRTRAVLSEDLREAALAALALDRECVQRFAERASRGRRPQASSSRT